MFKKLTTCLLALTLVFFGGTAVAADAEAPVASPERFESGVSTDMAAPASDTKGEALTGELARITQAVKTKLAIDDSYTDFYGEQMEYGYGVSWSLKWSSPEGSLSVEVDSDGLITSYSRYTYSNERYYTGDFAPIFPQDQGVQARQLAEDFARRVLAKGEGVVFNADEIPSIQAREQSRYYFSGYVTANGIPTPLGVSISVNVVDMSVYSYWRDTFNPSYIGGIPSGTSKIAAAAAEAKLAPLTKFELGYYRSEDNPKEARLQYRPVQDNTWYVDAQSGELLDMNKLYEEAQDKTMDRGITGGGMNGSAASMAAEDAASPQMARLSPTEQAGVEKMEGLLSREQLDAKMRAIGELGLGQNYILRNFNSRQESHDGETRYVASLEYYAESNAKSLGISEKEFKRLQDEGQRLYTNKYITVDAKSGVLESLYTYHPYVNELLITAEKQNYQKEAEAFLRKYFGEKFAQTAPWQPDSGSDSFIDDSDNLRYVRQVNGYGFEEDSIYIAANPFTGEIDSISAYIWADDITFAPVTGIISEDKARQLYVGALETQLVYRGLPQAIDASSPQVQPLMLSSYGYSILYKLALVYSLEAEYPHNVYAIDALDGATLTYEQQAKGALSYDDVAGHANQAQIEKLAEYGVGFRGGKFQPAIKLTELDMIMLLLSADGWMYETGELTKEKVDEIYRQAYALNMLKSGNRQPERQISRGEFVKTIISMSGYGKTAAIPGIYTCNFTDAAQIPAELLGYVAIAQGLGLVQGGQGQQFKAEEIINRAEAAVIFHNFMDRKY